jgi:Domain of unknown function (DUF4252)
MRAATLSALILTWVLGPAWAWAAGPNPRLVLPEFSQLADKASDSVTITLDAALLGMAAKFLDGNDPQDAAARDAIKGLQGIYIRSYTFDQDFVYRAADIDAVVKQLSAPGWTRLVQTRSRKERANVDIYIMMVDNKATGLALIASEPREFTIVNIVGSIDLDKLHKLQGHFGVPNLDIDPAKPVEPAKPADKAH